MPEVVAAGDEFRREQIKQHRVGGWVGWTKVVDRVHQSAAHKVKPNSIRLRTGEERIIRGCHPLGHLAQRIVASGHRLPHGEKTRRGGLARLGVFHAAARFHVDDLFAVELVLVQSVLSDVFQHLVVNFCERTGPVVVVALRPAIERVIVALRALQPSPEEHLRGGLGQFLRLANRTKIVGRRVGVCAAAGGNDRPGEFIHRRVIGDAIANPAVKQLHTFGVERAHLNVQQVGPL